MHYHENYSLKQLNSFGIDVSAKHFVEASTVAEIQEVLNNIEFAKANKLILGGGSNILFTKDYDGLVVKNNMKGIATTREDDEFYYVEAMAGEVWHELVMHCVNAGYGGLENLSLIPGNIGASPMQNIGAYGVEIKDVFHSLTAMHILDKEIHTFSSEDCKFGYRESVFKNALKGQYIILSVTFKLRKTPIYNVSYGAIETELRNMGVTQLSIRSISQAVCNIRNSKLPNPRDIGNAGSFFKNPEVEKSVYDKLKKDFPLIAAYPAGFGKMKLAAGWLIEACGWKGRTLGAAGVHRLQALVLVNYGNAKGTEIIALAEEVALSVKNKFGVTLEKEVNII
jgi:UDP-N-acetylmuramate dehydrogenase